MFAVPTASLREESSVEISQDFFQSVPDVQLSDLDGTAHTLRDVVRGQRGVGVIFWSGICSHCQRYDEWLNGFGGRHGLGLAVIASRQNEDADSIRRVVAQRGLRFPILVDADRRVAGIFQVEQTPRAFLLDAELRLLYRGAIDNFKYPRDVAYEGYFEAAVTDLMAGRPVGRAETPSFGCPIESVYYEA